MAKIVDFEQDPNAPFGTGNFRDDEGRQMYIADPDTASQFTKTMKGSGVRSQVGAESNAIAKGVMGGDPSAGPDRRLAENDSGTAATAGIETTLDALGAFETKLAEHDNQQTLPGTGQPVGAPEQIGPAPAGPTPAPTPMPATAPARDAGADLATLNGQAPAPPGAPATAGTSAATALVDKLGQHDVALKGQVGFRTTPRDLPAPTPRPTNGLPPYSTSDGETVQIEEGRPLENVVEQAAEEQGVGEAGDQNIRDTYGNRMRASDTSFRTRQGIAKTEYDTNNLRMLQARQQRREAEAEQDRLQTALEENDKSLDPDRVVRNMSTGKTLGMIILAALNGGFGAVIGSKDNDVISIMNAEIERDIDKQKSEIASGKIRIGNLIKKYMDQGFDAKTAETLARDKLDGALAAYKDLEAQRVGAAADLKAQMDMTLQQRLEARTQRRGELLAQGESKISRARRAEQTYQLPPVIPGALATPQDQLAQETVEDRRIQRENAAAVGEVVGHDVSIDEAKEIRNDSQDLGKRLATGASARQMVDSLRRELGMRKDPRTGKWTGDPDPGSRPFGISGTDRSKLIDTYYANLKRADIMGMVREPSAVLQNEFAAITERPFFDDQIAQQLDAYEAVVTAAEKEARRGFSDEAIAYYDRKRTPVTRNQGKAAPPPKRAAAAPPAGDNVGRAPLPKTLDGGGQQPAPAPAAAPPPPPPQRSGKPRGNLQVD